MEKSLLILWSDFFDWFFSLHIRSCGTLKLLCCILRRSWTYEHRFVCLLPVYRSLSARLTTLIHCYGTYVQHNVYTWHESESVFKSKNTAQNRTKQKNKKTNHRIFKCWPIRKIVDLCIQLSRCSTSI